MDILVKSNNKLYFNNKEYDCTLGRSGIAEKTSEGDGITPLGKFKLLNLFYRADKIKEPKTDLSTITTKENMGWCDDPNHKKYNQLVEIPFETSHEKMYRDDDLYNLVIETNYNYDPIIKNKGSAIFIHVKNKENKPTEGCIGLRQEDLLEILKTLTKESKIIIEE